MALHVCKCSPAAAQLLQRGCFPSAPLAPTLAVDLKVLDFVRRLFLNVAPNTTAWCKTVEAFLTSQGYHLRTEDSLRKRFGNALQWFISLQHATTKHVDTILHCVRCISKNLDDGKDSSAPIPIDPMSISEPIGDLSSTEAGDSPSLLLAHAPSSHKRARIDEVEPDGDAENKPSNPFPDPPPRVRPSDYLRSRCPLCFGGVFPTPNSTGYVILFSPVCSTGTQCLEL